MRNSDRLLREEYSWPDCKSMLGDTATTEEEVADALGEICNMIAGNFETGLAQIKPASQSAFDKIAAMLRDHNYRLRVEGHTDNVPIHTSEFRSNWELSTSRATEIVRLLIVREGFSPNLLSAARYAEYHPVATNLTAEGRGLNRRVDIVVLSSEAAKSPLTQAVPADKTPLESEFDKKTAPRPAPATLKPTAAKTTDQLQQ
jgi:hypothetical protein